jgi:hypothetical protein
MGNSGEGSEEGAVYQEMMDCDRSLGSEEALAQHRRDSPAQAPSCGSCNRSFHSGKTMDQYCETRPRSVVLIWSVG